MISAEGGVDMENENIEYCRCEDSKGIHTINGEFGYWYYCNECEKRIEDGFHYYDEPVLY